MEKQKLGNKLKFLYELSEELSFIFDELSAIHSVDNTNEIQKIFNAVEDVNRSLEGISLNEVNEQLMKLEEFLCILLKWPEEYDLTYLHKLQLLVKSINKSVLLSLGVMENKEFTANLINSVSYVSFSEKHIDLTQKQIIKEKANQGQLSLYRSNVHKLKREFSTLYSSTGKRVGRKAKYDSEKLLFELIGASNKIMRENSEFKQTIEEFAKMHIDASSVSIENDFISVVEDCNQKAKELGKSFYILTEFQDMRAHGSKTEEIIRYFKNHMLYIINFLPAQAACSLEVKAFNENLSLILEIKAKISVNEQFKSGKVGGQKTNEEALKELKNAEKRLNIVKRSKKFDMERLGSKMIIPLLPGVAEVYLAQIKDREYLIPASLVEKFIPLRPVDLVFSGEGAHYSLDGEEIEAWFQGGEIVENSALVGVLTYNRHYEKCLVVFEHVGNKELVKVYNSGAKQTAVWGEKTIPLANIFEKETKENKVKTLKTA